MTEKNEAVPQNDSSPILKFEPKFLDSLGARILQYKYALVKFERLLQAIDEVMTHTSNASTNLALVHYIIYLASHLFAICESGFGQKLEALENFKVPRSLSVAASQVVTHIPYDTRDPPIVPLEELPATSTSLSCLKAFRALCVICQEAYQKRFTNASREIANDAYLADLDFLFRNSFFDLEKDFDITLQSSIFQHSALVFAIKPEMSSLGDYSEASLIDIDLCSLFTIVAETSRMLDAQKVTLNKFKTIKRAPKNLQDTQLKQVLHSAYALHRVFFWALRVNEIYLILRKFGRQIFISNREHLKDQRFISYVSNGVHYRSVLREIDVNFFNTKKNGVLIATITRFLRMDSKHEISSKNVFDFVGFIFQSVVYMEGILSVLKEFGYVWLSSEVAFRTAHSLPVEYLMTLNDIVVGENVKELKAKGPRAQVIAKDKAKQSAPSTPKKTPSKQPSPALGTPTKTASSNGLPVSTAASNKKVINNAELELSLLNKVVTSKIPFYLQKQSSTSSLLSVSSTSSAAEIPKTELPAANGRFLSNSQPILYNAATMALKGNGTTATKQEYIIRSSTGSIKRSGLPSKRPTSVSMTSPLSNNRTVMVTVDEMKEVSPPKVEARRTASQRFQQHLMEASKTGTLYGKEKDVLGNVVFDPNNPSAMKLRRHPKQTSLESLPLESEISLVSLVSMSSVMVDQKPTRAQITKINTRRNSTVILNDNVSRLSDLSRHSVVSTLSQSSATESVIIKKVRFTGVPEYTPAEDAPETQKSLILKSFAALKIPTVRSAAMKRKDEALKQKESQFFKHCLGHGDPPLTVQGSLGPFAPSYQLTLKFTRFKNRF